MSAPVKPASDMAAIAEAADILRRGGLVAMPTETVYGLAADAADGEAVARLYAAKGRPSFNPLIVHVSGRDMAETCVDVPPLAAKLMDCFWPGPLTLVLPKKEDAPVSELAGAGLDTLGVRMPAHRDSQALIAAFGRPLVAPSANPSGAVSPTTAQHVAEGLGDRIDLILDAGPCPVGVESTVVAIDGDTAILLRPGGLARAGIEAVTGRLKTAASDAPLASPGMLKSHYAPNAALRLNAAAPEPGEAFLAFGPGTEACTANLSRTGDLTEAAANLFALLRLLDSEGHKRIAVAPVPMDGLGEAINDRLKRAAAPRD